MLGGFFHYSFLDGQLIGSEHPAARGSPRERIASILGESGQRTAMLCLAGDFARYGGGGNSGGGSDGEGRGNGGRADEAGLRGLIQYDWPMPSPPTLGQVAEAVGLVDAHLKRGDRVWVHCLHGLDRTGSVIGAYLCQTGLRADDVIAMLLERYPPRRRQGRMLELWRPFERLIRSFELSPELARSGTWRG